MFVYIYVCNVIFYTCIHTLCRCKFPEQALFRCRCFENRPCLDVNIFRTGPVCISVLAPICTCMHRHKRLQSHTHTHTHTHTQAHNTNLSSRRTYAKCHVTYTLNNKQTQHKQIGLTDPAYIRKFEQMVRTTAPVGGHATKKQRKRSDCEAESGLFGLEEEPADSDSDWQNADGPPHDYEFPVLRYDFVAHG